jgi:hypothetical protein
LNLAHVDDGSGLIGDIDMIIVLSAERSESRGGRLSISRHSAKAQVRRVVNAVLVASQMNLERREVVERKREP